MLAFVLIQTKPQMEHAVYNKLVKIKDIIEVHPLFGEYDLITKIEAKDFDTLGKIVVNKIRNIEGVKDTKTLTGMSRL